MKRTSKPIPISAIGVDVQNIALSVDADFAPAPHKAGVFILRLSLTVAAWQRRGKRPWKREESALPRSVTTLNRSQARAVKQGCRVGNPAHGQLRFKAQQFFRQSAKKKADPFHSKSRAAQRGFNSVAVRGQRRGEGLVRPEPAFAPARIIVESVGRGNGLTPAGVRDSAPVRRLSGEIKSGDSARLEA